MLMLHNWWGTARDSCMSLKFLVGDMDPGSTNYLCIVVMRYEVNKSVFRTAQQFILCAVTPLWLAQRLAPSFGMPE